MQISPIEENLRKGRSLLLQDCPQSFQRIFASTRQVILKGKKTIIEELRIVLDELISEAKKEKIGNFLNVRETQRNVIGEEYQMTLLAYAAYCNNEDVMQLLIESGASVESCDPHAGSTVVQLIAHCHAQLLSCCCGHSQMNENIVPECLKWHAQLATNFSDELQPSQPCSTEMTRCSFHFDDKIMSCTCCKNLTFGSVMFLFNYICSKKLAKPVDTITESDYRECQDILKQAVQPGQYPWNIVYVSFILKARSVAKQLIDFGADYIEEDKKKIPSYLLQYCCAQTTTYLTWLLSVLCCLKLSQLIERCLEAPQQQRGNRNPLHALLLTDNKAALELILQTRNGLLREVDSEDRTALHVAAELGFKDAAKFLIEKGADVWLCDKKGRTPLMVAEESIRKVILYPMLNSLKNVTENLGRATSENIVFQLKAVYTCDCTVIMTAIHIAVETCNPTAINIISEWLGNQTVFGILIKLESVSVAIKSGFISIIKLIDQFECANGSVHYSQVDAFLTAAQYDNIEIMNFYWDKLGNEFKNDALEKASAVGCNNAISFILLREEKFKQNIKIRRKPFLQAAENGHVKATLLLLNANPECDKQINDRGQNCLMIAITGRHRELVEALLKINNVDTFQHLMKIYIDVRKEALTGYWYCTPLRMLIQYMPEMARVALDQCAKNSENHYIEDFDLDEVTANHNKPQQNTTNDEFEIEPVPRRTYPSLKQYILDRLQKNYQNHNNHVLHYMVKYKRQLLEHKWVQGIIQQKWNVIMPFYIAQVAFYCVFLAFLTSFSIVSQRPLDDPICNTVNSSDFSVLNASIDVIGQGCKFQPIRYSYLLSAAIIIIILGVVHIVVELLQLIQLQQYYFLEWENYLQIFLFIGSVAFVYRVTRECGCSDTNTWQLGAIVTFCGWLNLIVQLRNSPQLGPPINLLLKIIWKYVALIYLPVLLVVSFSLSFQMLFVRIVNDNNDLKAFSTPGWALLRTFVAMTGDPNFDGIFVDTPLQYSPAAIFLFLIFLVVITVLFNNMLVGLAVGEVGSALEDAKIKGLACQVEFIIRMEDAFPFLKKIMAKKQHCTCAQKCCHFLHKTLNLFSKDTTLEHDDDVCDEDKSTERGYSELKEQIEATKKQLKEMHEQSIVNQDALRAHCEAMQKQLAESQRQNNVIQKQLTALLEHFEHNHS